MVKIEIRTNDKKVDCAQLNEELTAAGFNIRGCCDYSKGRVIVMANQNYSAEQLQGTVDAHSAKGKRKWKEDYSKADTAEKQRKVIAEKLGLV